MQIGQKMAPYINETTNVVVNGIESRANTRFFLDHSHLMEMVSAVVSDEKPWLLGTLSEGWEWFAFTFHDQEQIVLNKDEIREMLAASDDITKLAYSRMAFEMGKQDWAKHTNDEVEFICRHCCLEPGNSVIDFGCGQGRHAIGLARKGIRVFGIDYVAEFIDLARLGAGGLGAEFAIDDCRTVEIDRDFDVGICLYDLIGSYAEDRENLAIIKNLAKHIKPGGFVLLSVMNFHLTQRRALNWFSIETEPDKLLTLKASRTMETTGDVFDPEFYLVDHDTKLVYRKEQFMGPDKLPEELIVRDRRYTQEQIHHHCEQAGFEVLWSRFVRAGKWDQALAPDGDGAKEILVLCRKKELSGYSQASLF
ncbi:MAG: class I SAM-dependent methyltransferase [Terracidiphilus sp.]